MIFLRYRSIINITTSIEEAIGGAAEGASQSAGFRSKAGGKQFQNE
jgi:hypothetical protein